jgi:hypothetical protein
MEWNNLISFIGVIKDFAKFVEKKLFFYLTFKNSASYI